MTRDDRLTAILTAHNTAMATMAEARTAMRDAHRHIVEVTHAIEAWASAHDAAADMQDAAIAAVMDANHAALALLREKNSQ